MTTQQPSISAIDAWAQPGSAQLVNRPEFASLWRATGTGPRPEGIPVEELGLKSEVREKFLRLNAIKAFGLTE